MRGVLRAGLPTREVTTTQDIRASDNEEIISSSQI